MRVISNLDRVMVQKTQHQGSWPGKGWGHAHLCPLSWGSDLDFLSKHHPTEGGGQWCMVEVKAIWGYPLYLKSLTCQYQSIKTQSEILRHKNVKTCPSVEVLGTQCTPTSHPRECLALDWTLWFSPFYRWGNWATNFKLFVHITQASKWKKPRSRSICLQSHHVSTPLHHFIIINQTG